MPRFTTVIAALALLVFTAPTMAREWEEIHSATGTVKNTVKKRSGGNNIRGNRGNNQRGNNQNYIVVPEYVTFSTEAKAFRIRWETKSAGEKPSLKVELQKEVSRPNGKKDWRRVVVVITRARGDAKGTSASGSGPGNYRFELTGQNTSYTITVEAPAKKK